QVIAQHHTRGIVDVENVNCHDSGFGFANQDGVLPTEMAMPALVSRVEQRIQLASEQSSQIRPLGPIALRAGVTEAIGIVFAAMFFGNDVLDLERKTAGIIFEKLAVFATAACPLADKGSERGIHQSPPPSA